MKLADKIAYYLSTWCRSTGYDIIIPNFYHGAYEMDLFKLTKSGQLYEYEIKISRSDFFADAKKNWSGKLSKHELIRQHKHCNRFFYVVPEGLISIGECPDFAGLIYNKDTKFTIVKDAPKFKYQHRLNYQYLAQLLASRERNQKQKYRHERWVNKQLTEKLNKLREKHPEELLLYYIPK